MAALEISKLQDDLLPEVELCVTPCKLTDNVRVDLFRLDDTFIKFLVQRGHVADTVHNDVVMMTATRFPKFCQAVRDAYREYNMDQDADL